MSGTAEEVGHRVVNCLWYKYIESEAPVTCANWFATNSPVQTNLKKWLDGQTASVALAMQSLFICDCLSVCWLQQALAQTHDKLFEEADGRGQVAKVGGAC